MEGDVYHVVVAVATQQSATAIEVGANAHVVDTGYLHGMVDVTHYVDDGCFFGLVVLITLEDANLNDTTVLSQGTELVVGEVTVAITECLYARVRCKDGVFRELYNIPECAFAGMREVDEHALLVHFLHHLASERCEALAGIGSIGRRVADVVVVRVAKGDVVHAEILELADVLDVLANAVSVFDTDEEGFLSFGLQTPCIGFGEGNAACVLVFVDFGIDAFNEFEAFVYGLLQGSLITFALT